jgi:uncharacterized membrane protein
MAQRSSVPRKFFSHDEQQRIVAAIQMAEQRTSGEIRFHVERDVPKGAPSDGDPYLRARELFGKMGMHATGDRNGVLVYLAVRARRFAIVGDEQLHQQVGDGFWKDVAALMAARFAADDFAGGVEAGIARIGEKLREHFPYREDDVNELSDDISFGDEPNT